MNSEEKKKGSLGSIIDSTAHLDMLEEFVRKLENSSSISNTDILISGCQMEPLNNHDALFYPFTGNGMPISWSHGYQIVYRRTGSDYECAAIAQNGNLICYTSQLDCSVEIGQEYRDFDTTELL